MQVQITGDISRKLAVKQFEAGSTIVTDIPRDTVLKHLQISLVGAVQTTFASGTPVAGQEGTMNLLFNYIDIVANGSFTIKNVSPSMIRCQQLLATGNEAVRRSSAAASAASPATNVTVQGTFAFGTTTQYSSVVDSILVSFENVLAGEGRMNTLWDTRGLASAECKISTAQFSNILGFGNTAPVTWGNSTLQVEIETIESQAIPINAYFSSFKQTEKTKSYNSQQSDDLIDINRGNYLQGLLLKTNNGASGSATTATGKLLDNNVVGDLKLIINGALYIQNTTFNQMQQKNINRYGINAPFVANTSLMQGFAYMDLLTPAQGEKFGALSSAQDVSAPAVDAVQLSVSTLSTATYTSGATVRIQTNEIVPPAQNSRK